MKIGLLDVDGRNFPNLALMKLSAYHKSIGDNVSWYNPWEYFDRVYQSKVFTFSLDYDLHLNASEVIKGGTGYNAQKKLPLEIDKAQPDYSIYPMYEEAYGFLTRGCPNKCSWCIVPEKEGDIIGYSNIEEIAQKRSSAILMDNNVLSHEHGLNQIEKAIKLGIKLDFNQGLDARLITEEIAKLLSNVRWYKPLRMACDTKSQMRHIENATRLLRKHHATPSNYFIYVLVNDIEDAMERVLFLKDLGLDPFAQPYRDFENNKEPEVEQKRFSRWVNHKAIFKTVKWENYNR